MVKQYRGFTEVKTYSDLYAYGPKLGNKLYEFLIRDFAPFISRDKKLIIIPDEILAILPFEMLVTEIPEKVEWVQGRFGPYPKGVRYLGDDYQLSYYQSATSLTTIRSLKKGIAKKPLFALADPVFDSTDTRLTGEIRVNPMGEYQLSVKRGITDAWKNSSDSTQTAFPRLERSGEIAEKLRQSFGRGTTVLTGLAASEERVKKERLADYGYLVFATHGILDNTVSYIKEPALVLTQIEFQEGKNFLGGIFSKVRQFIKEVLVRLGIIKKGVVQEEISQEDPTPGFLTLSEVMDMRVGGEVVALTACNTGLGKNLTGEGVMGMGRAFQYAGAKAVLMSLWSVEDESTNLLTEHFFNYLKAGKDKLEALRLARSDLRKAGYEHPFYWAPFILVGER
ncbi:CHAT domain-containing protein [bacterium]|nr:CHAT domain-containing protein [bacterium]